jgi:hypothetical protein
MKRLMRKTTAKLALVASLALSLAGCADETDGEDVGSEEESISGADLGKGATDDGTSSNRPITEHKYSVCPNCGPLPDPWKVLGPLPDPWVPEAKSSGSGGSGGSGSHRP